MAEETNIESNENIADSANITPEISTPVDVSTQISDPASKVFPDDISGPGTHIVNFEQDYNDLSVIDATTFNDSINIALENMPNLERNQAYFDMIDRAAVDMDKYPAMFSNNNMDDLLPGRAGTNYDPFSATTGEIDLNSANGRAAFLAASEQTTAKFSGLVEPTPLGYTEPQEFGARRYNLDRYYRHPRFADLGFNPFANNEAYYQANSSKWDNFTRTRGAFTDMFGEAFTSGYRAIGDMFSGRIEQADLVGAQAMEDAMRIGSSTSGGARGFFNDLFLNSAYTMGILSNILVEEAIIAGAVWATGGAAAGPGVARTGANVYRGGKAISRLFSVNSWKAAGRLMMQRMNKLNNVSEFRRMVMGGGRTLGVGMARMFGAETLYQMHKIRQAAKAGDNMTQMAKASRTLGGLYRDFRMMNLAWAESKMEGGMVEMQMRDDLYQKMFIYNQNNTPTSKQLEMITADARQAAFVDQMINLPIIYLSNKVVLGTALRGFRPLGRVMDDALDGPFGRILRNDKAVKDKFYDIGKEWVVGETLRRMWKAGFKGSAKHLGAVSLRYSAMNFAEGVQELAQEATAEGTKAYFEGLYELDMAQELDMQLAEMTDNYDNAKKTWYGKQTLSRDPAIDINDAIKRGVSSQMSEQGMKVFLSGFLMGGMVQVPQKFMFNTAPNIFRWGRSKIMKNNDWNDFVQQKEETITNTVNTLNKIGNNLENYFDIRKLNVLTQKELNMAMYKAAGAGDVASFMDAKDHGIFSHLYTAASLGKIGVFKDMLVNLKKADNKTIKEAFENNPSSADKIRGRLDNMIERADKIQASYDNLKDKYVNPYDYRRYKKGTRKFQDEFLKQTAFEHARMMMMFTKDTFEQSLARANDIYGTLSSDPVLKTISAQDINILTSPVALFKEMALLREELDQEALTKKEKKLQEEKKKKLEILEEFHGILTAKENLAFANGLMHSDVVGINPEGGVVFGKPRNIGSFDKRKISKIKPAFVKYLKFLANKNGDFVIQEKIDDTLKKIIDHGYLKGRAMDYYEAMNILMNPEYLDKYVDRIAKIMGEVFENYKKKNAELIKRYVNKKIRVAWLEDLAVDGFQPHPDQTLAFLENGIIPQDYFDQEGRVTKESDLTGWRKIQDAIDNLRKTETVKTAEQTDAPLQENEKDIEKKEEATPEITTPEGQKIYQDFLNKDKNTVEIINAKHKQYKLAWNATKGPYMEKDRWAMSDKGGLNIIKARYALTEFYENLEDIDTEKYPNMDSWLADNQRNLLVVGSVGILPSYGVSISDVSLDMAVKEGIPGDKINSAVEKLPRQEPVLGINILETTIYDDDNTPSKFYEIVNNKKENVFDQYKELDTTGLWKGKSFQGTPAGLKEAIKVFDNLKDILSDQVKSFPFAGVEITTGDIIQNKAGEKFMIKSAYDNVKKFNNIWIVPIGKAHLNKGKDDRQYLTDKQFKIQGWEVVKENKKINVKKGITTKITRFQPLMIYPFNGSKVKEGYQLHGKFPGYGIGIEADSKAQTEFERILRNLSEEQRQNLSIKIDVNPEYAAFKKELDAGNITSETNPFKTFKGFEPNPDLAFGQNELEITIMNGAQPIGMIKGLTQTLLFDQNGDLIDGKKITAEQAANLFTIGRNETAEQVAGTIRRNYAKAELILEEIKEKLGKKKSGEIRLSDLEHIEFTNSTGYNGWRVDRKTGEPTLKGGIQASTSYADLEKDGYTTFDGEVIIYDTRRNFKTGRRTSVLITSLDPNDSKIISIEDQIQKQLEKDWGKGTGIPDLNMGRYVQFVKLPNGEISYFELKTDPMGVEDLKTEIANIKNIQQEILKENKKDGKYKPKTDKFDPDAIVYEKNQELNNRFYINTNRAGRNIELFFDKRGQLGIKIEEKGKEDLYAFIDAEDLADVTEVNQFVEKINNALETFASLKDTQWKVEDIKGIFKSDSINPKLPMLPTKPEDLIGVGVSARIIPTLKFGMLASINYTNNDKIQDKLSGMSVSAAPSKNTKSVENVEESVVGKKQVVAQDLTDEIFEKLLENELENIPAEIIQGIRNKIVAGTKLQPNEELIVEKYKETEGIDLILEGKNSTADAAIQKNEDNLQSEIDNEDIKIKIAAKQEEIRKIKSGLENEIRTELQAKNPGMSKGELNVKTEQLLDDNKQLKDLTKELNTLRGQRGFKIVDGYDSRDIEHIKKFVDWAQQNLPEFIQIKDIEDLGRRLSKNGVTLGAFLNELAKTSAGIKDLTGTIYVGKQTGFRYHEAFHAVFRMMLSEAEIKQYLNLAKVDVLSKMRSKEGYEIIPGTFVKSMSDARNTLKRLARIYAVMDNKTLDDRIFEEYLADEFEKFKANPRSTGIAAAIKSFFNKIVEFIKHVFLQYKKNEMQDLFNSIDGGKFKNASIQDNRFTNSSYTDSSILEQSGAVTMVAPKIRKGDPIKIYKPTIESGGDINPQGRITYVNNYLSDDQTSAIVTEVSALYIRKLQELSKSKDFNGQYNPKTILDEILESYIKERDPYRNIEVDGVKEYFYADRENWNDFKDDLKELHDALKTYKDDVIEEVNNYLNLFDLQIEDAQVELDRNSFSLTESLKSDEDYESSANEIGGVKSLSKGIRLYLATRTKQVEDPYTKELVSVPVDYMNSYRALMKSLAGKSDPYEMLVKLKMFSETSEDAKAVIDDLFTRFNLDNYTLETVNIKTI